jgi:hypothetical protein
LRYQAGNGLAQGAINGGFDIWQRGTSFSAPNYCADRWYAAGGNATYAQESTTANLPTGFRYGLKMTMSATDVPYFMQAIETANAIYFAGKRVVLSYYVSSSASSTCNVRLDASTGTDTSVTGTYTQITAVSGYSSTQATTTSMTRVYSVYDVPSDCKTLRIIAGSAVNITSTNTMTITGVQLEVGSVPTTFRRAGGTIQGELAACQRYYQRITATTDAPLAHGIASSTTVAAIYLPLPVTMRTTPSVSATNVSSYYATNYSTYPALTALSLYVGTPNYLRLSATVASGLTLSAAIWVGATNANPLTELSAEL